MRFFETCIRGVGQHGRVWLCLSAWCLTLHGSSLAQNFGKVRFEGLESIESTVLENAVSMPLPASRLQEALRTWGEIFYQEGLLQATLQPDTTNGRELVVRVSEGSPALIGHVFVRGTEILSTQEVLDIMRVKAGVEFRPRDVEAGLNRLLDDYGSRGYLYATAILERLEIEAAHVTLGIALSEGRSVSLGEIQIEGNTHTRDEVALRYADLKIGRPLNMRDVDRALQLLRRSELFAEVLEPALYRSKPDGSEVGVQFRVVEVDRRNTVFGTVGVAQDPRNQEPYVNGAIDLQLENIFGTGRDLGLAWKRDALTGSHLKLSFRERFLLGWPLDVETNLVSTVRDSTYTYQSGGVVFEVPLSTNLSLQLGSAFDRSVFHTALQGNTKRFRQRFGLRWRSLQREEDGVSFGTLRVDTEVARKSNDLMMQGIEDRSRVRQTLWNGDFDAGFPVRRHHVLGFRGEWHFIDSNEAEVPESELYYFGGARSLRGYREDQFRGDQVAFGSMEYRIGDPRSGRLYGFVDVGALRRKLAQAPMQEEVRLGYGLGLRGRLAAGVFDLSFGLGEERSFSGIKVHVSLLQRF